MVLRHPSPHTWQQEHTVWVVEWEEVGGAGGGCGPRGLVSIPGHTGRLPQLKRSTGAEREKPAVARQLLESVLPVVFLDGIIC